MSWFTIRSRCCAKLTCWRSRCQRRSRPGSGAGWVCRCWRAISTAGPMPATPPINWILLWRISATRSTTRRSHIADARYQTIAAICDAVSNTLTAEPSRFTAAMDKVILNRFLGLPIFLFVMYLMFPAGDKHRRRAAADFDAGSVAVFIHGIQWLGYTLHFPDWLTVFLAQGSAAVSTPYCRWCRRSA
ncbi:hypothetical protein LNP25_05965 [Klebsiella variicola subsp. variicola]|nr:hypothetical protein [Klebsiella variicola subsp. variicola]